MRDIILRTAADLFDLHGLEQVSFDEIAATVCITAGVLRIYFTSTIGIQDALAREKGVRDVRDTGSHLVS